jgi:hypothetical protein
VAPPHGENPLQRVIFERLFSRSFNADAIDWTGS